jgi:hypothetical protein
MPKVLKTASLLALLTLIVTARPVAAQTVLTCGQVVNESIAAPLEQDHFTFFGEAGDVVTVTLVETSEIDSGFAVVGFRFSPGSTTGTPFGQGALEWTLTDTGTHTIRINDVANTRRGNYSLRLAWHLPLNKRCGDRTTMTCGQVANGSIATPLEQDVFAFDGQQGDVVTITLVETGDIDPGFAPVAHRFDPNSAISTPFGQGITHWTLPDTGTYTIRVSDVGHTRRGTYSFRLAWLQPFNKRCGDRATLSCGQVINGSIATPLEQDEYTFSGVQGQVVTITLTENTEIDSGFAVIGNRYAPSTTTLPTPFGQGVFNLTLPETGIYTIMILDVAHTRRGTYAIRLGAIGACPTPQAPGPPTALTATVNGSVVTLTWNAPTTGGLATSYVIEAGSSSGGSNLAVFDTGNDSTSFVAAGVPNGIYYVRVRARNAGGTSVPSNEVVVVVGTTVNPPGPPTNLVVSVVNNTVNLSWTAPATGGTVTSYLLEAGDAPSASNLATFDTGNTATGFTAFAVPPGTYFVRVRARNAAGTSAASNEVVILVGVCSAPPSAPSPLSVVVAGNVVTLNWTAPSGPVTTYVIEAGSQPGAIDLANVATGNTTTSLGATATRGTYFVRVRARNGCGTSAPSNEVVITIP